MRSKTRLTITLSPDLVQQLDRLIDRETIRSRSHAIELLVRQSLNPSVSRAVLLAGGKGDGSEIPALSQVDGQPLISHTVRHFVAHGIRSFLVLAGRHEPEIRGLLGDGGALGADLTYVSEARPLGTAGALKQVQQLVAGEPFLVVHADVLTNIDVTSFIDFHMNENTLATMAVKPRNAERNYGKVMLQGNKITEFIEQERNRGISIINTGVYLFRPEVLALIEDDGPSRLETDIFPKLAEMGELSAFFFQGIWYDVRSPVERRLAEARWQTKGVRAHASSS